MKQVLPYIQILEPAVYIGLASSMIQGRSCCAFSSTRKFREEFKKGRKFKRRGTVVRNNVALRSFGACQMSRGQVKREHKRILLNKFNGLEVCRIIVWLVLMVNRVLILTSEPII